jgi:sigma-B regulation protein RsbU (phosphoserine phosphatase)
LEKGKLPGAKPAPGILVIDDEPDFRSTLADVLEREGYSVATAGDVEEGKALLDRARPDVLLVDWTLPNGDGLTLLRYLRGQDVHRDRYAILVTARNEPGDVVRGIAAGADDYIRKPFDNEELLARVRVGIRTRCLQRDLAEKVRLATVLEMAGALAHEVGNPLTAAELLVDNLRADPRLEKVRDDLDALRVELSRIEQLVRKAQSVTAVVSIPYVDHLTIVDLQDGVIRPRIPASRGE